MSDYNIEKHLEFIQETLFHIAETLMQISKNTASNDSTILSEIVARRRDEIANCKHMFQWGVCEICQLRKHND